MRNSGWVRLLAYVTGSVNQELLLRNEYLAAENRILRTKLPPRLLAQRIRRAGPADVRFGTPDGTAINQWVAEKVSGSLRKAIHEFVAHYHLERPIMEPAAAANTYTGNCS
jgi:hypothetical protein